jgi:hypothetical protein
VENPDGPMCGQATESSGHALWWCNASQVIWAEASRRLQKCTSDKTDFLTLLGHLSSHLEREELELFAMVAQQIWLRRNRVVFGGPVSNPQSLVKYATETLLEYRKAQEKNRYPPSATTTRQPHWFPPPLGSLKLNWDAAVDG